MISVWYLIIVSYGNGRAMVSVPQASREQCTANVEWIQSHYNPYNTYVYCVPGVK